MEYDAIIVGSGPGGLTAALYCARGGKKTLVLGGESLGGVMSTIHSLENYPGTPAINGYELAVIMRDQAIAFGAKVIMESAIEIAPINGGGGPMGGYSVKTENGEYNGRVVILATGTKPRKLEATGVKEFTGRGVSYCATCDGFFYTDKDVIVVGGGNSALNDALYLANMARSVTILHYRDKFSGVEQVLLERAQKTENIKFLFHTEIEEILGDDTGVNAVMLKSGYKMNIDGVFIAIGLAANTDYLNDEIKRDEKGRLAPTALPTGMFVCGDITSGIKMQVATAVGTGCEAAMDAIAYLNKNS